MRRFERFPKVQVIDLDAAMGTGDNLALVRQIAGALSCRVGGGIRTVERAQDVLDAGAQQIIAGSSLFKDGAAGPRVRADAARRGRPRARHRGRGQPRRPRRDSRLEDELPLTAVEAVRALEPFCDEFLYTHVDAEGLMGGTNIDGDPARSATPPRRRVTAAGGITTQRGNRRTRTPSASTPSSAWRSTPGR